MIDAAPNSSRPSWALERRDGLDNAGLAPVAAPRPLGDRAVGGALLGVVEPRQRLAPAAPPQRLKEQPVGQPGVLGQDRTVQVGAVHPAVRRALAAVHAVVAASDDDPTEPAAARAEERLAAVVLEADQCAGRTVRERDLG